MDSATNWHDTYWTYEFLYKSSIVYVEALEEDSIEDYYTEKCYHEFTGSGGCRD